MKRLKDQWVTLVIFASSSLLIVFGVYVGIPYFMERFHIKFGEAYLFCFYVPFVFLFIGHFFVYIMEGGKLNWNAYCSRLRLRKFNKQALRKLFMYLIIMVIGFGIASLLSRLISDTIPFLSVPDRFPAGLNHNKPMVDGYFFDVPLSNNWLFALLYLIGWFFNIFGEELMFRGMLLPKNEKSFGEKAWLFHGILWGTWHVFWFWQVIPLIIFVTIPFLYIVQRSKNTWTGIVIHGTMNFIPLIVIIYGIITSS